MARVIYNLGFTRNMSDFESLRFDVGIEADSLAGETTAEAFDRAKKFVDDRFFDGVADIELDVRVVREDIRAGKVYKRKVAKSAEHEESK